MRPYWRRPPELSERQAQLYGLARYDDYRPGSFEHDLEAVHAAVAAATAASAAGASAALATRSRGSGGVSTGSGDNADGSRGRRSGVDNGNGNDDDDDSGDGDDAGEDGAAPMEYDGEVEGKRGTEGRPRRRRQCARVPFGAGRSGKAQPPLGGGGGDGGLSEDDPLSGWSNHGGGGSGPYGATVGDGGAWVAAGCGPTLSGRRHAGLSPDSAPAAQRGGSSGGSGRALAVRRLGHPSDGGGSVEACADACTARDQPLLLGPCVPCTFY